MLAAEAGTGADGMTVVEAGFSYIESRLVGVRYSPAPPAGQGRTDPHWARMIYRDVLELGQKQHAKPCFPCVLVAFSHSRESFTYGMRRGPGSCSREHYTDAWFVVRAVTEEAPCEPGKPPLNADLLAHEVDKALDPEPAAVTTLNGYAVLASFKEESIRTVEKPGSGAGEKRVRYLIGGRYKIILQGDGA